MSSVPDVLVGESKGEDCLGDLDVCVMILNWILPT
jgi:hypothetical protein